MTKQLFNLVTWSSSLSQVLLSSENIKYGDLSREISEAEIIEAAKSANIHDFIDQLPEVKLADFWQDFCFI